MLGGDGPALLVPVAPQGREGFDIVVDLARHGWEYPWDWQEMQRKNGERKAQGVMG